jgi:hypothetical protein
MARQPQDGQDGAVSPDPERVLENTKRSVQIQHSKGMATFLYSDGKEAIIKRLIRMSKKSTMSIAHLQAVAFRRRSLTRPSRALLWPQRISRMGDFVNPAFG